MARERKGTLVWRKSGWNALVTVTVDGEPVRKWFPLDTENKPAAKRKLARLVAKLAADEPADPSDASSEDTVAEFEASHHARRMLHKVAMARDEHANMVRHALPEIGVKRLSKVKPADVASILDNVVALGLSQQTVRHVRAAIYRLFKAAWRDELIRENPVARVAVPKVHQVKKERVILTDGEFVRWYLSPAKDLEVRLLGLVARFEGGMRTSDLHRWDWSMLDRVHFNACTILRSKTGDFQELEMPPAVSEALRARWEQAGRPETGPYSPHVGERASASRRRCGGTRTRSGCGAICCGRASFGTNAPGPRTPMH